MAFHYRPVRCVISVVFLVALAGCQRPQQSQHEKSISVLMWTAGQPHRLDQELIREFTRETGIHVRLVPGSESASRRLQQELSLFRTESTAVDVFEIDTIWTGMLADYLADLKGALKEELPDESPPAIANATVSGRLIAAPFLVEYGLLYYRTDLLKRYGFSHPPRTWDELEKQSGRIQHGERLRGKRDFWGYVWQGADYEGLTCNALEWQMSQGGGNFLEPDRTVDVNNPNAVRAFARAARWVGTISPPGVLAYLEEDSRNMWESDRAMFLRNWSYVYHLAMQAPDVKGRFAVAPMPAGSDLHSSAMGGWYLGVSKYSIHLPEAVAFVKYMTGRVVQKHRVIGGGFLPTFGLLYRDTDVLKANPFLATVAGLPRRAVRRPAAIAGSAYDGVSRAYAHGVHTILAGKVSAAQGAADIQAQVEHLTGFTQTTSLAPSNTGERPQ